MTSPRLCAMLAATTIALGVTGASGSPYPLVPHISAGTGLIVLVNSQVSVLDRTTNVGATVTFACPAGVSATVSLIGATPVGDDIGLIGWAQGINWVPPADTVPSATYNVDACGSLISSGARDGAFLALSSDGGRSWRPGPTPPPGTSPARFGVTPDGSLTAGSAGGEWWRLRGDTWASTAAPTLPAMAWFSPSSSLTSTDTFFEACLLTGSCPARPASLEELMGPNVRTQFPFLVAPRLFGAIWNGPGNGITQETYALPSRTADTTYARRIGRINAAGVMTFTRPKIAYGIRHRICQRPSILYPQIRAVVGGSLTHPGTYLAMTSGSQWVDCARHGGYRITMVGTPARNRVYPFTQRLLRSTDYGRTWTLAFAGPVLWPVAVGNDIYGALPGYGDDPAAHPVKISGRRVAADLGPSSVTSLPSEYPAIGSPLSLGVRLPLPAPASRR